MPASEGIFMKKYKNEYFLHGYVREKSYLCMKFFAKYEN
jgi:hypothetical protein